MNNIFDKLFIFEMANNHQGSVEHGRKIIHEMGRIARIHGIKGAVKFQYRDLGTLIHPDWRERREVKHIPRFVDTALTENDFRLLISDAREEGLMTVVTPFDEISVSRALAHGVDILKIASCSAADWPLLETVSESNRPIIASTGGMTLREIDRLVSFFEHKNVDLALLHCLAMYPAPEALLNLNFIARMQNRYSHIVVGYSGHEDPENTDVVKIAVSKGARILERHVGVPTEEIKLNAYSSTPEQADNWVQAAEVARGICGDDAKKIHQAEIDSLQSLRRGVYAAQDIQVDETIEKGNVFFAMPCVDGQTFSGEFGRHRTAYKASKSYKKGEAIKEKAGYDSINLVRDIVHDAKGMLREAHLEIGEDVEIELSHHYGINDFYRVGAVIVSIVNRGYCKKLVIVFPGQRHPAHAHKIKEETFQLLWGDLKIDLEGTVSVLKPGDKMLVEAGNLHSFSSKTGGIFEEISSTHRKKDSFYEDSTINAMDLMERKTIVTDW